MKTGIASEPGCRVTFTVRSAGSAAGAARRQATAYAARRRTAEERSTVEEALQEVREGKPELSTAKLEHALGLR